MEERKRPADGWRRSPWLGRLVVSVLVVLAVLLLVQSCQLVEERRRDQRDIEALRAGLDELRRDSARLLKDLERWNDLLALLTKSESDEERRQLVEEFTRQEQMERRRSQQRQRGGGPGSVRRPVSTPAPSPTPVSTPSPSPPASPSPTHSPSPTPTPSPVVTAEICVPLLLFIDCVEVRAD
jgi:type II secretory pathway pseudopilin PulG